MKKKNKCVHFWEVACWAYKRDMPMATPSHSFAAFVICKKCLLLKKLKRDSYKEVEETTLI